MYKVIISFLFLLLSAVSSHAQDNKSHIGIGLFRLGDAESAYGCASFQKQSVIPMTYVNCLYQKSQKTSAAPSIFFTTRIYKNLQARINYHFVRTKTEYYSDIVFYDVKRHRSRQYDNHLLATGIQYNIIPHRKLSPYIIADFAHQILNANKKLFDSEDNLVDSGEGESVYEPGFSVGLGLRYLFMKNISASFETHPNGVGIESFPISRISINYHF